VARNKEEDGIEYVFDQIEKHEDSMKIMRRNSKYLDRRRGW
jgi:hypothetical protein